MLPDEEPPLELELLLLEELAPELLLDDELLDEELELLDPVVPRRPIPN